MGEDTESGWISRRAKQIDRQNWFVKQLILSVAIMLGLTAGIFFTSAFIDFGISSVERVRHHNQITDMEEQILKIAEICND